MKLIKLILLFLFFIQLTTEAQKYSNEFMAIGVGGRALGMSNSVVASTNDVTSGYWNPAGLVNIESNLEIMFMHSNYFAGIAKYDYGSVSGRIDKNSRFGVSLIRLGVDDIPNTLEFRDSDGNFDYDRITSFSIADYGFLFSYAKKSNKENFSYGGNVKVIHRKAGEFGSAWGFGVDLGAQYKIRKWMFGGVLRDATTTYNAWSYNTETFQDVFLATGNEIPENSTELTMPRLLLGGANKIKIGEKFSFLPEIGVDITFDKKRNVLVKSNLLSMDPHFGFEVQYVDFLFFRGGIGNIMEMENDNGKKVTSVRPSIGIGVRMKSVIIDYALSDVGNSSEGLYSNVFSIKLKINSAKK